MTSPDKVRIQLAAYEDMAEISQRVRRAAGPNAAESVTDQLLAAIEMLENTPYLGPLHQDPVLARMGCRKLIVGKYVVVYRVNEGCADVLRVFLRPSRFT